MAHEGEQDRPADAGPVERPVRPVAWIGQPGYVLARTRAEVEYKTRKDQNPTISPLYDQAALDAAVAAERERCAKRCDEAGPNESDAQAWAAEDEPTNRMATPEECAPVPGENDGEAERLKQQVFAYENRIHELLGQLAQKELELQRERERCSLIVSGSAKLAASRTRAAEDEAIERIPAEVMSRLTLAQAKWKAEGGCKGCGSLVLGVHLDRCPASENDLY